MQNIIQELNIYVHSYKSSANGILKYVPIIVKSLRNDKHSNKVIKRVTTDIIENALKHMIPSNEEISKKVLLALPSAIEHELGIIAHCLSFLPSFPWSSKNAVLSSTEPVLLLIGTSEARDQEEVSGRFLVTDNLLSQREVQAASPSVSDYTVVPHSQPFQYSDQQETYYEETSDCDGPPPPVLSSRELLDNLANIQV
jgi:hypothetical protein